MVLILSSRVLQVVWSGVGWDRLQPLMDHQLLPTLGLLQGMGTRGQLTSLQPQVAIQLSQSLLSGLHAWRHGLAHPLRLEPNGETSANTLADATHPGLPAWLDQAGQPGIWVGWPHLAPGVFRNQHMVPRAFAHSDAAADPALPLQDCRVLPDSIGLDHLKPFFPDAADAAILADPMIPILQQLLAAAGSLQAAATRLMQRLDWNLCSVRFELGDRAGQLFGDCHPPLQDHADPQRVFRYQHLVTGAYRLLDMMLARLVQLAGPDALILVHSDKGTARPAPPVDPAAPVHQRFRAGHDDRGFLLLAGKSVRCEPLYAASILDIAPTLMAAMGFEVPESSGRVLREGLDLTSKQEPVCKPGHAVPASLPSQEMRRLIRDDAIAHGDSEPIEHLTGSQLEAQTRLYRALNMMQYGAADQAMVLLEQLTRDDPEVRRYMLHRARCHLILGQLDLAKKWGEQFVELGEPDLRSHLLLGRIALRQDRSDQALVYFFQAEQLRPDDPTSHCQIGDAYRRGGKPEQARDAFQRALLLDPLQGEAHLGLAKIELQDGNHELACEACLKALESDYRNAEAHFHLGVGLARLQKITEAIQAFEACLSFTPNRLPAHEWLARLYKQTEGGLEKSAMHQAQLMSVRKS